MNKEDFPLPDKGLDYNKVVSDFKIAILRRAVIAHNWNVAATAEYLGLKRATLCWMLSKFGIKRYSCYAKEKK